MTLPSYAHVSEVKVGTKLRTDGGFTCIDGDQVLTVEQDERGELFIPCDRGRHYIEGQLEDGDHYIGLSLVEKTP